MPQVTFQGGPLDGNSNLTVPAASNAASQTVGTYVMIIPAGKQLDTLQCSRISVYADSSPPPSVPGKIWRYSNANTAGTLWQWVQQE